MLTAASADVPLATPLISLPPALMPLVVIEIALVPVPLGVIVIPLPLITLVSPPVVVKDADVKPVKDLARRIFNVPAPSDTTPILPVVRSVGVAIPPLTDNTSPCLRTDVVPVSPSNLCSASANACVVLSIALLTTSATFLVVATPSLPAVVPCVAPVAPTLPVVSSITSLPSSTFTVYVFTPATVASLTVARPVPATFTASCAAVAATALTAFSETVTV